MEAKANGVDLKWMALGRDRRLQEGLPSGPGK